MTHPTINVNLPADSDPIGEGAERIRETRQALYDIFPIKREDLDPGMRPDGSVSKEYVDEQDQLLQDQIDSNKGNIESNAEDIGVNAGNIANNAIDISNNSDSISNNASAIAINAGNTNKKRDNVYIMVRIKIKNIHEYISKIPCLNTLIILISSPMQNLEAA